MWYGLLADVLVAVHLAYVSFVLFGFLAVVVGMCCRWQWVRNRWFRCIHVAMIGFVAFESIIDMECPLTTWENQLREAAGQPITGETFIGRMLNDLLFCNWPGWVFNVVYVSFALLVLSTFVFAPVRWRRPRPVAVPNEPAEKAPVTEAPKGEGSAIAERA